MSNTIKAILIQQGEPSPNNPVEIKKLLVNEEAEKYINNLKKENQQLKKQKDDVVKNAKEKIKRYESYIHDLKNGNYPSPTVRQERQELIFRIREQEDLLRMLGEIE